MLEKIQKKLKGFYIIGLNFFKTYLAHIVFLVFTFQLLSFISSLPYFNLIDKYNYYVLAILWIFSNFLFKKYIINRKILIGSMVVFAIAIPITIVELEFLSDILGFVAFILLLTYVLRQIFTDREILRET